MLFAPSIPRLVCCVSLCLACTSPTFKDADAAARGDTDAANGDDGPGANGSMDGGRTSDDGAPADGGANAPSGSDAGSSSGDDASAGDGSMSSGTGWECTESGTSCSCTFCGGPICPLPSPNANAPVCANYGCCFEFSPGSGFRGCICSERDEQACEKTARENKGTVVESCPPPGEATDDRACVNLGDSCARADLARLDSRGCCEGSCILDSKGDARCQDVSGDALEAALACEHSARKIIADEAKLVGRVNTNFGLTNLDTVSYLSANYGDNVCLNEVRIDFDSTLDGCELSIHAGPNLDAKGRLVMESLKFEGSQCDGLSGGEHVYETRAEDIDGTVAFEGVRCESANEGFYCAQGEYRIEIGATLSGSLSFPDPIIIRGVMCGKADVINAPCAAL